MSLPPYTYNTGAERTEASATTLTGSATPLHPGHHEGAAKGKSGWLARLYGWNRVREAPGAELSEESSAQGGGCAHKSRVLYVNDVKRTQEYAQYMHKHHQADLYFANGVCTSKYTMLNFLPKSMFEQFRRVANFYFLIISLLQLCTNLSPTNEYSTIGPLTIVLLATMVKEGIEDRARHQQDYVVNHQKVDVLGAMPEGNASNDQTTARVYDGSKAAVDGGTANGSRPSFQSIHWRSVRVGQVIKIHDQEQVPADIVLLFSSHEDAEAMCETSSLDGESNLKVRHCMKWNHLVPRDALDFACAMTAEIRCEMPNKRLYSFDGVMRLVFTSEKAKTDAMAFQTQQYAAHIASGKNTTDELQRPHGTLPDAEEVPINIENVLLRGMKLCNTKWAIGVVVGAGNDTKLVQNMKAIPSKFSRLDRIANRCIFLIFSVLFAVCCISSVQAALFAVKVHASPDHAKEFPYIHKFTPGGFLEAWVTYLILYNNMVPISLYISLEIVKWYQARRIESDPKLKCPDTGLGVTARTSNVNEDLGQIKYIFSDKTGTLTRNQMLFKVCSIGGIIYDGSAMKLRQLANVATDPGGGNGLGHLPSAHGNGSAGSTGINADGSFNNGSVSGATSAGINIGTGASSNGGGAQSSTASTGSTDGRRVTRHASLSEKDVRPFFQLAKMIENQAKFAGREQQSLELARPFFRCLLLCHSASASLKEKPTTTTASSSTAAASAPSTLRDISERTSNSSLLGPLPTSNSPASKVASPPVTSSSSSSSLPPPMFQYFGSSPDEVALLNAATEFQCIFEERDGDLVHIRIFGVRETYRILALNEFDSVRKCMSVVAQQIVHKDTSKPPRPAKLKTSSKLPSPTSSLSSLGGDDALMELERALEQSGTDNDVEEDEEDEEDSESQVLVFCKGADTVMFANAANTQDISKLGLHVHYFAAMALRTLLLGYKTITKRQFTNWKRDFDFAKKSLSDREHLCLEVAREMETSIELLGATGVEDLLQDGVRECIDQLVQAGVNVWMLTGDKDETAISVAHMCGLIGEKSKMIIIKGKNKQDCLDEIANARRKLKREGVWVPGVASRHISLVINGEALEFLLADAHISKKPKASTGASANGATRTSTRHVAASAAHAAAASSQGVDVFGDDPRASSHLMLQQTNESASTKSTGSLPLQHTPSPALSASGLLANTNKTSAAAASATGRTSSRHTSTRPSIADGVTQQQISQLAHELFMELATQCASVVACRLSPMQKAQVVALMKSAPGSPLTLAVGDGGNDVSMIQEAHVGVGIYGHEGMQAVRAADFAIATFRHLSRLLLVHGRWNHRRVARVILFSFYKNMALIMTLFLYSQRNGYSGQTLYESYLMVGWNVLYTVLPIFVLGIADEDIRDHSVLKYPFVYRTSLKKSELSIKKLSIWVLNALLHSMLVFFFTMGALNGISSVEGHANGLFTDGTAVYGALVITVTLKASLTMQRFHRWTRFHYLSLLGGFVVFLLFVATYSHAYELFPTFDVFRDFQGIAIMLFREFTYWILILFTSITCIAPDIALTYLKQMYLPSSDDIIQEIDSGLGGDPIAHGGSMSMNNATLATRAALAAINTSLLASGGGGGGGNRMSSAAAPPAMQRNALTVEQSMSTRSDDMNRIMTPPGTGASSNGSTRPGGGRSDLTSSLLDGEWSQKFRDFDRPTEHDELSKQLIALQRELAQEVGLPDPILREDEGHSSRALNVQPHIHPLSLEFMGEEHQQLESEYELTFAFRERVRVILCLKISAVVIPLYALYEVFWEGERTYIAIRIGYFVCDLVYMRIARTKFFLENYQAAILVPYWAIGLALTLTISDTGKFAAAMYPIGLFVVIRVKFLYALILSIFNFAFYLLADKFGLKEESSSSQDLSDLLLFALYMVFVICFGAYSCYSLQTSMRKDFLQSRSLLLEQKRSTQILKNMLPEHVVQRMQKGETLISEDEKDVTILFCDIADFASFVKRFSPTEVVSLLDRVYSLFDQICQKHNVRKMETVGKTYMACAGLQGKDRGREAALRAVAMAVDMLAGLDRCRASNGNGIRLRIGIHSGRVISGLVGMKKQQFSLFGDTVNTASRMQSTGVTGRCQVSHVTYKKLAGHFAFEEREIQVKGKGTMTTYMLGEPLTELARMACAGQLEHIMKRESLVAFGTEGSGNGTGGGNGNGKKIGGFDPDFLSVTRQKILQRARQRIARSDIWRMLLGSPPTSLNDLSNINTNLTAMSGVEQHMLTEIHHTQLRFKEDEMEYKYLDSTLMDRVEGARATLFTLFGYAIFACLRDLTMELLQTRSKVHGRDYSIDSSTYIIMLVIRSIFALFALFLVRHARTEFPEYSEIKLRNVLLGVYLIGLGCFAVPQILLWRLNYGLWIDASSRYVNLCLDTVLVMFLVSNGGSILHRHAVSFNLMALVVVTATSIFGLQMYAQGPANMDLIQGYNNRFKTSYPIVLTYLSVIANNVASQSVEFFTRRQIWLKTRTQMETMNADRLLYQMLPAAVVMRLKEGETVCDQHQQVGILFSDIKGFTSIASQANPAQVVNILASLFCAFDKITEKHGVFKMQTIGDAYVIVSGLPYVDMSLGPVLGGGGGAIPGGSVGPGTAGSPNSGGGGALSLARGISSRVLPMGGGGEINSSASTAAASSDRPNHSLARRSTLKHKFQMHIRSHIRDLLAMARDMHKEVRKVTDPNTGERLQMRIGIHIGNIIGGVIGTSTLRYDMWGPDALTANELESNGVPERTLVSPVVMEVVKGMPDIKCTFHKKTSFTNVAMMDTYLVDFVEAPEAGASGSGSGSGGEEGGALIGSVNSESPSSSKANGASGAEATPTTGGGGGIKAMLSQGSARMLNNSRRSISTAAGGTGDAALASVVAGGGQNIIGAGSTGGGGGGGGLNPIRDE